MANWIESFSKDDGWKGEWVGDGAWVGDDESGQQWRGWWIGEDDGWMDWALKMGDGAWVGNGWTVCELQWWCMNFGGGGEEDDESVEVRVWWGGWERGESLIYLRKGRSETAKEKRNRKKNHILMWGGFKKYFLILVLSYSA